MTSDHTDATPRPEDLIERAKELSCLYRVDEILADVNRPPEVTLPELADALPAGWKYPDIARARVRLGGRDYAGEGFRRTRWILRAPVFVEAHEQGSVEIAYLEERPPADEGPFLKEERRLIDAIAARLGHYVSQRRGLATHDRLSEALAAVGPGPQGSWTMLVRVLERSDPFLLQSLTRKLINHLCWNGIPEGDELRRGDATTADVTGGSSDPSADTSGGNRPLKGIRVPVTPDLTARAFTAAVRAFGEEEVLAHLQAWMNEETSTFLIRALEETGTSLAEVEEAVERFRSSGVDDAALEPAVHTSLTVALLRRFFVEHSSFLQVAKRYVRIGDFYDLVQHLVYPTRSQGKLGGKGGGLFLATQILQRSEAYREHLPGLRIPKTWYVASDAIIDFIRYNHLDEVYTRKYLDIERVRQDYPHVVQLFKSSRFPPDIVKGLAAALDDFGDRPLIVRSSSLLEDQVGASFSGKYKSLFLANQGPKHERLVALQEAIAEVYASVFAPDPIEYRRERGLLDFREEMAILIQEVVGTRMGRYFLPAFSGVAFSENEFRWSPRLAREDGLVRLVPGLGTRAVDRVANDYPVMFSPGHPELRVNTTPDEIIRYSPTYADVIDLEENAFTTITVDELLREHGHQIPRARDLVSIVDEDRVRRPVGLEPRWKTDQLAVTADGLLADARFVSQFRVLLKELTEGMGMPVDIEFASDGEHFYLVQCRSQSRSPEHAPAPIPRNLPAGDVVFSANRYVSNGRVPDITHIVYVRPEGYANLGSRQDLQLVARAVGRLNELLPWRQFVLLGPGRWGSRGDIKLGVGVTYADIDNAAVLLEMAAPRGGYMPEPSFGTHFFQDLVEAGIRYIPLYPQDPDVIFNERFLEYSTNVLADLLPDLGWLEEVIRVIDVPREAKGRVLRILMNADLGEAVGVLATPTHVDPHTAGRAPDLELPVDDHWSWRLRMAERIAAALWPGRFDVKAIYVFGSTKNATAGPASDIDLLLHVGEDVTAREDLSLWLDGWSRALAEINYLRTGYRTDGLLGIHYVTDEDIAKRTSFAVKIGAVTDAARPLAMGVAPDDGTG